MAASKPIPGGIQKLIECSVCLEVYQVPSKAPKTLQCGHTFCLPCLHTLVQSGSVRCSECRKVTSLPKGCVDDLITNFNTIAVLESSCEVCRDQHWVRRCGHCGKNVCEACHDAHREHKGADVKDILGEAKIKIKTLSNKLDTDTFLDVMKKQTQEAEKEVAKFWDDIIKYATERKEEDFKTIQENYQSVCKDYIKWKKQFLLLVTEAMSQLEEISISTDSDSSLKGQVDMLVTELQDMFSSKPDPISYQINQPEVDVQSLLSDTVTVTGSQTG